MKNLNTYIQENTCINEKLVVTHYKSYSCAPETEQDLRDIIKERLKQDPNADLNDIDVSNIKNMNKLFVGLDPYNIDISRWDVSNVQEMSAMFFKCKNFNSDLNGWDVSKVEDMEYMFYNCDKFDSDLSSWDVSKCKNMWGMFVNCDSMKELPKWHVEK